MKKIQNILSFSEQEKVSRLTVAVVMVKNGLLGVKLENVYVMCLKLKKKHSEMPKIKIHQLFKRKIKYCCSEIRGQSSSCVANLCLPSRKRHIYGVSLCSTSYGVSLANL
jgi:hypothetical protein